MSVSIYLPIGHYNTMIKCTHKHILFWCKRNYYYLFHWVSLWTHRDSFVLFLLRLHLRSKSLSVGLLLLLRVSWAKEHFPNPTQPQVPEGTPEALQGRKHFSSRLKEHEDTFVYYCLRNVLKNSFLNFFLCAHTATSDSKLMYIQAPMNSTHTHTRPAVNVCLSRWMSCLLFPRALITG